MYNVIVNIYLCLKKYIVSKIKLIKEFQTLTSFIPHRTQQILKECFCKRALGHKILNEVLIVMLNVVSDHDSICLSSETSDVNFSRHVLIKHQI